ncbi:jg4192 [Pararge aegeria aegeria]|uniref:Jg4192 protein n=1 Tax=Pararge aegeria aegeria TaxID=348720 RepID=A0A8S4QXS7_9NEOP|nr:jg4192 [Pararge aegeria aegeria]
MIVRETAIKAPWGRAGADSWLPKPGSGLMLGGVGSGVLEESATGTLSSTNKYQRHRIFFFGRTLADIHLRCCYGFNVGEASAKARHENRPRARRHIGGGSAYYFHQILCYTRYFQRSTNGSAR